MNQINIKQSLENHFGIGFMTRIDNDTLYVKLKDSDDDKFFIKAKVINDVRLNVEANIENHAANFLRLIGRSNRQKRINFDSLWKSNNKGEIKVYVNNRRVSDENFIVPNEVWDSFYIEFTEMPYENDSEDKELTRVIILLVEMMLSLVDYKVEGFSEGSKEEVISRKYERNPINRTICLNAKGYTCQICGFNFEEKYGDKAKMIIEVHHITPVSTIGDNYVIDPINDLIPICPNCHTLAHKKNPPYTPNEIKQMIKETSNSKEESK